MVVGAEMFVAVLLCLLSFAESGVGDWPFSTNFQFWFWQSAVVVDQWLYIEGGEYYTEQGNGIVPNALESTLSIDLSQSWNLDLVGAQNNTKPPAMSPVRRPPLWYDPSSNLIMERGGWAYTGDTYELWSFTPDGNGGAEWSLNGTASSSASQLAATFGGASTASASRFYSLGGVLLPDVNMSIDGLTQYDFADGTWHNTTPVASSQSGFSVQAQAAFMPNFGEAGLLAVLGGDSPQNQTYYYEAGAALVDMSNITVYDVSSGTWYHQTATGSVPPPRSEFCAVGSAAKDNSSYEIYVFGGSTNGTLDITNADDVEYLDVFILSMPSFFWFQANTTTDARRANHFCQVIGQGQMLVIGGRDPSQNNSAGGGIFWPNSDPWPRGMNIFNMNNLTWTRDYDASITYDRPAVIQQYYANHANNTNWSDPALAALFTPKQVATPGNNSSSPPSSESAAHSNHTGAIVGGIVGGIAGLLTFLLLAFYIIRRRRAKALRLKQFAQKAPPEQAHEMLHEEQKHELEMPPAEVSAADKVHGMVPPPAEMPANSL